MSQSRWNPRFSKQDKHGKAEPLTLPSDTKFVGTPITMLDRDKESQRVNTMIHSVHVRLGNAVADDESDNSSED